MTTYQEETYGERIAEVYDEWYTGYDEAIMNWQSDMSRLFTASSIYRFI